MSAEPLSREQREEMCDPEEWGCLAETFDRYEATVQEREATIARVRNALAALDGHTCHVPPRYVYQAFADEVRAALEGAS